MRREGTWGGDIELQAASLALSINITIHQLDQPRWEIINFPRSMTIQLSFHDGQHYNSVIALPKVASRPMLVVEIFS
jgi:OTU domain-containing protein 3